MEPSEEFCLSGCTCSFRLGPGSVVEEKVKKGVKQQKKKKTRKEKTNKDNNNYNYNKNHGLGCGKGQQKKRIPVPSFPLFCHFRPFICCISFFFFAFSLLQPEPGPTQVKF